jgi:glycosyltransferase involved in cell wall biosynthesis
MGRLSAHPRILIVVDSLEMGGPARLVVSSAAGLVKRGLDVRVAHLGIGDGQSLEAELRSSGVSVFNLDIGSLLHPRPVLQLSRYLRDHRVDLVHTHNPYAHLVGRPAAALAGRPSISTVHSIVDVETDWRDNVRRRLDHLSARCLCRLVITVSDAQRCTYLARAGVPPARVQTLWNGVDTAVFRPNVEARTRVRARLRVAPDQPVFVTVSVLREGKGLEDLLDAIPLVLRHARTARFLIVGDGPLWSAVTARVAASHLQSSVTLLGQRADVEELLAASDVYVHPAHFEALPTSVLEAMAVGLPVVACDVGGIPEIVRHAQTGLLVQPRRPDLLAFAMLQLVSPGVREAMGASGRAWVETHASLDRWLDSLWSVYERVTRN